MDFHEKILDQLDKNPLVENIFQKDPMKWKVRHEYFDLNNLTEEEKEHISAVNALFAEYEKTHCRCPQCQSKNLSHQLMAWTPFIPETDPNQWRCLDCDWKGLRKELVAP